MSEHTLQFPKFIADEIGLSVNEINALRGHGCPFYGRKTCVAWVRAFLNRATGAESLLSPPEHPQRSGENKSGEQVAKNG